MNLLRNREVRIWLLTAALTGLTGTAVVFLLHPAAGAITGATVLILWLIYVLSLRARYRRLAGLATYLRRIMEGETPLEPDTYREGELSILHSEIYKAGLLIREKNRNLVREKTRLQDAVSDIAHQLRTPLSSLMVMNDLLGQPDLEEDRRTGFHVSMGRELDRLQWLVEALLKMSRLDAGAVEFRTEAVAASDLIRRAAAPLSILMELRHVHLEIQEEPVLLRCDPAWTAEALTNLLKNAVEHTPEDGTVTVTVTRTPFDGGIVIRDAGPGFSAVDLKRLFDRFYRGTYAGPHHVGIGLAMARAVISAQDGRVSAGNREDGGGAELEVTLPRHREM